MNAEMPRSETTAFSQGYFGTPRHALLDLLPSGTQAREVLELGCGHGANLAALKRRLPGCTTTGVELEPAAAAIARGQPGVDALIEADLGSVQLPAHRYDLIVLSHVIEHFAEPAQVLQRARGWLARGGHLLVALPNVRHVSVVLPLVFNGEFRYREAGVLDATHLRFFTRKSSVRFFEANGWRVERACAEVGGRGSWAFQLLTLGLARDFAAFAHNFLLREGSTP